MSEDPGARKKGKSLLGGFSPLLAKLKERDENRREILARFRDSLFTWQPGPKRGRTRKPVDRGPKKRRRNKAAKLARRMNRKGPKRPKGYRR
jgi:hypothetical protein